MKTKGLTARAEADGSISFVDAKGGVVSVIPAAVAWDAAADPGSGEPASVAPVVLSVVQHNPGQAQLTITPDPGWVGDPARVFPITVDPAYAQASLVATFDTFTQSGVSSPQGSATELKTGTYNGGTTKARTYLQFDTAPVVGAQVQSAAVKLWETHSYSCTPKPVGVWSVKSTPTPFSTSTVWSNQPDLSAQYGTADLAAGYSSACAAGWVEIPVTAMVQGWSAKAGHTSTIAIVAGSETDTLGWKKFASLETATDPQITYTYNRAPATASTPVPKDSGFGSPFYYVPTTTPTFHVVGSDPDANLVKVQAEVYTPSGTPGTSTPVATCTGELVASGAIAGCVVAPALTDNSEYTFRVRVLDEGGLASAWTGTQAIRIASLAPPAPVVSCPGYVNDQWAATLPASAIGCTVTAAATSGQFSTYGKLEVTVDGVAQPVVQPIP